MFANYVKIALKVLGRRKFFTFISLFAISFTLTVLMVVTAMVDNALAPEQPETRLSRLLLLTGMRMSGDRFTIQGDPGYAFIDRYTRDMPGVEAMSICSTPAAVVSFVDGEKITSKIIRTDGSYWDILDFAFIEGAPFTEQDNRQADLVAVISETTRERFFDDRPATGQTIECDGQRFRVVGVVEDVPITRVTALADIWVPISTTKSQVLLEQLMGEHFALYLAESKSDFARIKAEFRARLEHVDYTDPERFNTMRGVPMTRFETLASGGRIDDAGEPRKDELLTIITGVLAFLLLPITNLISINVSRILERASEIGVRKAFGASSAHLVGQFVFENIILCLLGGAVALVAAAGVLALINASGVIPNADFRLNPRVFAYALLLSMLFGLLSGAYPAWRMSRLHPVQALRGETR